MLEQIVSKLATQLAFIKRTVHINDVSSENIWIFDLGVKKGVNIPVYVVVGFLASRTINFIKKHKIVTHFINQVSHMLKII